MSKNELKLEYIKMRKAVIRGFSFSVQTSCAVTFQWTQNEFVPQRTNKQKNLYSITPGTSKHSDW